MPKQKTRKAVAKRIRVTATGKIVRTKAGRRHLLANKSRKRKRNMRRKGLVAQSELSRMKRALVY